ncbi:DUF6435 family protein [Neptuniibacter caesariensis]|uniref:Putative orphan protein n=1 Tax=Neptuniibacter caesariensis TaxID=207954 RepID=A0A7U8C6D3_NEPCE|nr:DUF6435 family protein [Neptuniibacter caesariensis]EAR60920.1 putative orphan protein [Oceanospirillum sp. MED92] [Neptuniibacter caesariensis]
MFSFLKSNPEKKLKNAYHAKLEKAMQAQRAGDIEKYSFLTREAEELHEQLKRVQKE